MDDSGTGTQHLKIWRRSRNFIRYFYRQRGYLIDHLLEDFDCTHNAALKGHRKQQEVMELYAANLLGW